MGEQIYKKTESRQDGMRVVCEFPEQAEEGSIYEIKAMLSAALWEYVDSLRQRREQETR